MYDGVRGYIDTRNIFIHIITLIYRLVGGTYIYSIKLR